MVRRRVGSLTCGFSLIIMGILYILASIRPEISYITVMRFWPIILIGMGFEILSSVLKSSKSEDCILVYDKGAIILLILMILFALGMGTAEWVLDSLVTYSQNYL